MLKRKLLLILTVVLFGKSYATHIVGGDITVKWITGNDFEVTLTFWRDCNPGNATLDFSVTCGVFDKTTNVEQQQFTMSLISQDTLALGDSCYTPPNLCVEEGIYRGTITIPNNPNGYYITFHRCCRNYIINNIISTISIASGYVFYVEISDPALQNSTPVFSAYPDAYMCSNIPNTDDFAATDANGDSLVYSLTVPLDCSANLICSATNPIPPPAPAPYGNITWVAPYNLTNILGDLGMNINALTGVLSTNPPTLGVFVFTVRVEEFRAGIKIGEVRRDVQFQVLSCPGNSPPAFVQPTVLTYNLVAGEGVCFPVEVDDPNPTDFVELTATSELFNGSNMPFTVWASDTGTSGAQSNFCIETGCPHIRANPYVITFSGRDSSCYGGNIVPLTVNIYVLAPEDGGLDTLMANIFTPNGDNINDHFRVNANVNYCFDTFSIKIYNRWGQLMFESDDLFFKCD